MKARDRILKSILILACSILLVCSIPFPSNAAALGSIPYDFDTFYPVFRTLLLLGGLTSDDPVRTGEYDPSTLGELDPAEFLSDFLDDAGTYQQGLNLKMIAWCAHAIQYGRFLIPEDEFQTFKSFLISKFGNQVGASVAIGSIATTYTSFPIDGSVVVHTTGYDSNGNYHDDYLPFYGSNSQFAFLQNTNRGTFTIIFNVSDSASISWTPPENTNSRWSRGNVQRYSFTYNNQRYYYCTQDYVVSPNYKFDTLDLSQGTFTDFKLPDDLNNTTFHSAIVNWRNTGAFSIPSPVNATIAAGVDALTAIGNKVISSTTDIDSTTGNLTGTLSVALPNFNALNEILDSVRDQNLSYAQALQLLNVKAASASATTQELNDILEVVKASTLPITDALTSGYAKQAELAAIAGSVADTLTQETIEKIRMGYDPDQESPPYWPMWLNWLPPDLDFDDPSGDTSGILPQVVNVFGITSGWITELLEASGAFSYLFYIGILFVLFSVVVGMYHFIGNLNSRPSGNPSVKAKIEGKSVTVPKGKKGS